MRKITVLSMITLDGVMQGPGGPGEDKSGGFKYGGWVAPYDDEVYGKVVEKELKPADYLLGRKTFKIWENYWPAHADFWPGINDGTKISCPGSEKSDWKNSVFLKVWPTSKGSKNQKVPTFRFGSSGELIQLLLKNDLVDELRLKIHPLTLGKGKSCLSMALFQLHFTIIESLVTPGRVIIANYKRAENQDRHYWSLRRRSVVDSRFPQAGQSNSETTRSASIL
jgi:dihydrofolate reductase